MRTKPLVAPLSTNGLGNLYGGQTNLAAATDYPTDYFVGGYLTFPTLWIQRLMIYGTGGGSTPSDFGNGPALTTGLDLQVRDHAGRTQSRLTPEPITQNSHWSKYCYDAPDDRRYTTGRWSFNRFTPLGIELPPGWRLTVTIHEPLNYSEFQLIVQGHYLAP